VNHESRLDDVTALSAQEGIIESSATRGRSRGISMRTTRATRELLKSERRRQAINCRSGATSPSKTAPDEQGRASPASRARTTKTQGNYGDGPRVAELFEAAVKENAVISEDRGRGFVRLRNQGKRKVVVKAGEIRRQARTTWTRKYLIAKGKQQQRARRATRVEGGDPLLTARANPPRQSFKVLGREGAGALHGGRRRRSTGCRGSRSRHAPRTIVGRAACAACGCRTVGDTNLAGDAKVEKQRSTWRTSGEGRRQAGRSASSAHRHHTGSSILDPDRVESFISGVVVQETNPR